MKHKLIVVLEDFNDEDHARWYGQYIATEHCEHMPKVYVVVGESEDK